jgi:hypothetical protein
MEQEKNQRICDVIDLVGVIAIMLIFILAFSSCRTTVPNISHPSKKEIRKAMKHSTWEYKHLK